MKNTIAYSAAVALSLGLFSLALSGCGASAESESTTPPATAEGSGGHGDHDHGAHDHGKVDKDDGMTDMEKMKAELAKLSPEDAASALKQHICPVSGDMLGTTGAPIKVDIEGKQVWICCEDCRDQLLDSPEEFLAKLKR